MSNDPKVREYCTANLVHWLRAKYTRHGELEDKYAADALESYATKLNSVRRHIEAGDISYYKLKAILDA